LNFVQLGLGQRRSAGGSEVGLERIGEYLLVRDRSTVWRVTRVVL
jgi:hypothetical protein